MEFDQFKQDLEQAIYTGDTEEKLFELFTQIPKETDAQIRELETHLTALRKDMEKLRYEFDQHMDHQAHSDRQEREALQSELQEAQTKAELLTAQLDTAQSENMALKLKNEDLEYKLRETLREKDYLSVRNALLTDETASLRTHLDEKEKETGGLQEQLRRSEAAIRPFRPLLARYTSYCALSESLLRTLTPILLAGDPVSFWVCGCQFNTLLHVWDAVKLQLEVITPDQIAVVTDILAFFIAQYNSIWDAPVYELMSGEIGESFDQQRHIRSSTCSPYQGKIQQVILPGIWNRNRKIIERKCVVYF